MRWVPPLRGRETITQERARSGQLRTAGWRSLNVPPHNRDSNINWTNRDLSSWVTISSSVYAQSWVGAWQKMNIIIILYWESWTTLGWGPGGNYLTPSQSQLERWTGHLHSNRLPNVRPQWKPHHTQKYFSRLRDKKVAVCGRPSSMTICRLWIILCCDLLVPICWLVLKIKYTSDKRETTPGACTKDQSWIPHQMKCLKYNFGKIKIATSKNRSIKSILTCHSERPVITHAPMRRNIL